MQKYIVLQGSEAVATIHKQNLTEAFEPDSIIIPSEGRVLRINAWGEPREFVFVSNTYAVNSKLAINAYEEVGEEVQPGIHPMDEWGVSTNIDGFSSGETQVFVESDHPFLPFFAANPELFAVSDGLYSPACSWKQYRLVDFAKAIKAGLVWKAGCCCEE